MKFYKFFFSEKIKAALEVEAIEMWFVCPMITYFLESDKDVAIRYSYEIRKKYILEIYPTAYGDKIMMNI